MASGISGFQATDDGANMVRLRTLILLRWMAIAGQVAAILVASQAYDLHLPLGLCALAVGASVLANLLLVGLFPESRRLSEAEAFLTLLFDLGQLGFLLLVTGGLTNPFAILVLAPVTISASVLSLRSTLVLGCIAILVVSTAVVWYLPLRFADGSALVIPQLFAFGFW
ncbi:MAG: sensor histidine kinase, partial [Acetobacteraceae bacterium]